MSFFRSFLLLSLVTLFSAAGLIVLGFCAGYGGFRGGYAVLQADADVDDRLLIERLSEGGNNFSGVNANLYAGSPVSESSQWVLLDDFGSLQRIPLDKYNERVFPFDPRNDGYAGKLRDVFVRDGKRYVYIPLKAGNWAASSLNRHFYNMLSGIPFSAEYFGIGKPLLLFFIAYTAASLSLIIICYVKRKTHHGITAVFALLPSLSCLVFFGVGGFSAAALFIGLFVCFREPALELVKRLSFDINAQKIKLICKDVFEPYKMHLPFLVFFAFSAAVIVVFTELKLSILLLTGAISFVVFLISVKTVSLWNSGQRRFVPVMIIRRRFPDLSFSLYMTPLAVSAFIVMLLTPYMPGAYTGGGKFNFLVEEKDYFAHLTYQASFSTRQLGGYGAPYPAYMPGGDGLPVQDTKSAGVPKIKLDDFPPFPVKHLMDFFKSVNPGGKAAPNAGGSRILETLSLLILLLFILPGLLFNGKIVFDKILLPAKGRFAGFKKFAGMLRRTDINRKNMLLYNSKNTFRIRKDA
ncbi:MAG: hypothetical protein LBV17_07940 [Treponema sp.]|jgi:hypothetical protein|nr:hypothetical protein [Treponema sp.]